MTDTGIYISYPFIRNRYSSIPVYSYFYEMDKFQVIYDNNHPTIRYFDTFKSHIIFDFYLSDDNNIEFIDLPKNYNSYHYQDIPNNIQNGFKLIVKDIKLKLPLLSVMQTFGNIK